MRNKEVRTCCWGQHNSPLVCPSASVHKQHAASAPAFFLMWLHVRDLAPPILSLFFSHSLMALEPALLPWEPVGDSRRPLHLFPFIPFWKWIKYFLFRLAWKNVSWLQSPEIVHSRCLIEHWKERNMWLLTVSTWKPYWQIFAINRYLHKYDLYQ